MKIIWIKLLIAANLMIAIFQGFLIVHRANQGKNIAINLAAIPASL
ncbi:hypothetical protein [Nostoc sp. MG11]|nr:hypothetical protein [Nostoc sp. MG11]